MMNFLLSHEYSIRYKKRHLKDLICGSNDIPLQVSGCLTRKQKIEMKQKRGEEKEESEKVIKQ